MHDARVNCCVRVYVRERVVASLQDYIMRRGNSRVANREWGLRRHRRLTMREGGGGGEKGKTSANARIERDEGREEKSEVGSLCATMAYRDERTTSTFYVVSLSRRTACESGARASPSRLPLQWKHSRRFQVGETLANAERTCSLFRYNQLRHRFFIWLYAIFFFSVRQWLITLALRYNFGWRATTIWYCFSH